jgi:putative membrane protein
MGAGQEETEVNRQRWMPACMVATGLLAAGNGMAAPQATNGGGLAGFDRQFIMKAAEGGMMEVRLGQLAQQRATNPAVKQFGQRMVKDHSKANSRLMQIAQKRNVTPPKQLGTEQQQMIDHMSQLQGAAFDQAYMAHMVEDHQKDLALFQQQARRGRDPSLRTFARSTLPTLRTHFQIARSTARRVGAQKGASHHGM